MYSKKFLSALFITCCLFATSCLKNDSNTTTTVTYRDPSLEVATIDSFADAMGYTNMVYDANLTGFKYEIIERGDTSSTGLISSTYPIGTVKYIGKTMKGIGFDSTYQQTDSVAKMAVYANAVSDNLIYCWTYTFLYRAVPAKIGKGGHIRFITPSAYAYGSQSSSLIPANSPLFFDIELKDVSTN